MGLVGLALVVGLLTSCHPIVAVPAGTVAYKIPPTPGLTDTGGPTVALTFDDGPSAYTLDVLHVLESYDVPATFFVVGSEVKKRPWTTQRIDSGGFGIGVHSMAHRSFTDLSSAAVRGEIRDEINLLDDTIGPGKLRCVRPPNGARSARTDAIAGEFGLGVAMWSVDPRNWSRPGTSTIASRVLSTVGPRSVVILHDGGGDRSQTVAALPAIIEGLQARGYQFVQFC